MHEFVRHAVVYVCVCMELGFVCVLGLCVCVFRAAREGARGVAIAAEGPSEAALAADPCPGYTEIYFLKIRRLLDRRLWT